ncbi:hypothetical protein KQ303_08590 [Synechococcus sp. CS-1333]|nr:hypothetical protein [Synechococcus sp. CS-1333]MCT0210726.1 hypothetical protein [Synechococcus sp. CS-1333]
MTNHKGIQLIDEDAVKGRELFIEGWVGHHQPIGCARRKPTILHAAIDEAINTEFKRSELQQKCGKPGRTALRQSIDSHSLVVDWR